MPVVSDILNRSDARFGTSGLRGLVSSLSDELIFAITYGFLTHLEQSRGRECRSEVLIGEDLRPSSQRIARAVAMAVHAKGMIPVYAGVVPTPALALAAISRENPAIMVTGSHIPADRNGVKFFRPDGEISKDDETEILRSAFAPALPDTLSSLPQTNSSIEQSYIERYANAFPSLLKDRRIGIYQHSAAGRELMQKLFVLLGAEVVPLGRTDGFVPIDTEDVSKQDLQRARQWVQKHALDALVSTDGDGDRPLLADETGFYFRGDVLGILTAYFLKAETVVTPISTTTALESCNWFDEIERTRIGSPHVIAGMNNAQSDRIVGFEPNGGFLTKTPVMISNHELPALPTRDALLPVLAVIALSKREKKKLFELPSLLPSRFTASGRIEKMPASTSSMLLHLLETDRMLLSQLVEGFGVIKNRNGLDGQRFTTANNEVIHFRPSGNAPELRIYTEASNKTRAEGLLNLALERTAKIWNAGHLGPSD